MPSVDLKRKDFLRVDCLSSVSTCPSPRAGASLTAPPSQHPTAGCGSFFEMSLPSGADASVLRDRVAALAARVEELETEAEADRALYLRIGMGHTDPELKAKPESEVFGALEQQNRDALYELKKTKSQKYQLKQRVDELEKALESAASVEPVSLTIVPECARCVERADAEAEAEEEAKAAEAAAAEAKAEEEAEAKAAEAKAKAEAEAKTPTRAPPSRAERVPTRAKPSARDVRDAVDVLSAHARGDASSAMSCAALHLCLKHRDQCSNAESLMRRTIVVMKNEAREAGRRSSGVGFGPGKELAGALRTTKTSLAVVAKTTTAREPRGGVLGASLPQSSATKKQSSQSSRAPVASPRTPLAAAPPSPASPYERRSPPAKAAMPKRSLAELTAPDARVQQWMAQKAKKEEHRDKMKKRVVDRDVKWMESMSKRQSDRLKQSRKQEEAAAAAMRVELLKSRAKSREAADAEESPGASSSLSPGSPRPGTPGSDVPSRASTPSVADERLRLFGEA